MAAAASRAPDMALALAMIQVIISENLTDVPFVREWTAGFDRVAEQTRAYTPAWAEKVTGVPAEKIVLAARVYAQAKSACLIRGSRARPDARQRTGLPGDVDSCIYHRKYRPAGRQHSLYRSRDEVSQNTHRFICSTSCPSRCASCASGMMNFPCCAASCRRCRARICRRCGGRWPQENHIRFDVQ